MEPMSGLSSLSLVQSDDQQQANQPEELIVNWQMTCCLNFISFPNRLEENERDE